MTPSKTSKTKRTGEYRARMQRVYLIVTRSVNSGVWTPSVQMLRVFLSKGAALQALRGLERWPGREYKVMSYMPEQEGIR